MNIPIDIKHLFYGTIEKQLKKAGLECPVNATDKDGNKVTIHKGANWKGGYYFCFTVHQKNGWDWNRIVYEHGYYEETYEDKRAEGEKIR